jgi:type IV pilus assembly protein PilM
LKFLDSLIKKWFSLGFGANSPSKTILGVDISSSAIKLIEMEPSREGFNVIAYGVEPLPEGATFDREIVDVAKIAQVLHSVYKKSGARSRNVAVAVSGSSIISNYIDVPSSLTAKQVEARVKLEADTIIPFPLDEINLDFAVVGQNIANKDHVRVQVVACQRDYVDRRKEVMELAGLNPVVVDIESFAFARAYQTLINFTQKKSLENSVLTAKDEIVAIVDIGATQFTFLVLSNQSIIYSVEQPFGGRQLTEDIQRHYNLTWAEAGRAKRKGGLDADYDEAMLNPFKTLLIEHLARSIQVFYSSTDTDKIDKLVLSGGVSKTDGLRDQVAEAMGIPAEVIDLSKSISVSHLPSSARLTADIPAMMLAFGLALAAESQ